MHQPPPRKRALISVYDKRHLLEFAKKLVDLDIELLSTGGTARLLREQHIPVTDVSDCTGFPEILGGRVKTLHPKIHGGILARPDQDAAVLQRHDISPIQFVIVNFYPFSETVANPQSTLIDAIENIDIGGPTLLRAAAKNYHHVTIITDSHDYAAVLAEIQTTGNTTLATRLTLAQKAFSLVADYDASIANYFNSMTTSSKKTTFPATLTQQWQKKQDLRYGENPHQAAAFYIDPHHLSTGVAAAKQHQGKELSYNNLVDAETALECVKIFETPACAIVKHANPCGVATAETLLTAYEKAFQCDPTSAFGGIIAFNRTVDDQLTKILLKKQFMEVVIAPEFTQDALTHFQQKSAIRVLSCDLPASTSSHQPQPQWEYKAIGGGLLIQEVDTHSLQPDELKIVTRRSPSPQELQDLLFAWKIVKFAKSNAIVFVKNQMTVGIGAGQMSRVDSVAIAVQKAKHAGLTLEHTVLASDAFFPFKDSVEQAVAAGATAIIQPGGSIRDEEVIKAADDADIAMVFTGIRHFKH